MLVLTRNLHEKLFIEVDGLDTPIQIILCRVDRGRSKIGIVADEMKVKIYREEVYVNVLQERINLQKSENNHAEDAEQLDQFQARRQTPERSSGA